MERPDDGYIPSEKIAQTCIFKHGGFFVSTMLRSSSAPAMHGAMFEETIVWKMDPKTCERGEMIAMPTNPHTQIVQELMLTGELKEESDDE